MADSPTQEVDLTPDLLEFAQRAATKEASMRCRPGVGVQDAVQEAMLELLRRPIRFDPTRGAKVETLIYTIVQRAVIKFATRESNSLARHGALSIAGGPTGAAVAAINDVHTSAMSASRAAQLTESRWTKDDLFEFIDNEETRAFCQMLLECGGNRSEVARRLNISEGAVRDRIRVLAPKLLAAGFHPFSAGGAP